MKILKDRSEFDSAIQSDKNLCALFTAEWCPDCHVLKPVMPELEKEFSDTFDFISVDRDQFLDLCQEQDIFGIPSFLCFRAGKETGRFVSRDAKTREEIESFLRTVKES
ncbi:MAG: thioredoxin family protein [Spirochaetales bacterium]|nr:thioredoxin family protein [Spirochaetales bacterium]